MKAVIFDIDGVLISSFDANLHFFQELMATSGYRSPTKEEYLKIFHLPMWDVIKTAINSSSEKEIRRIWDLGRNEVKYPASLLTLPENAEKTIEALGKKYILGIATSRVREGIDKVPVLFSLVKYFQAIVSYQDTKNHKPHPEPLLLVCEKLGVVPEESVYIGDAESDIQAGKAAGMKVILYSKEKFANADAYATSFAKLPEIIDSL